MNDYNSTFVTDFLQLGDLETLRDKRLFEDFDGKKDKRT